MSNWLLGGTWKAKENWIGERLGRAFRVEALGYKAPGQWSRQRAGMVGVHRGQEGAGVNEDMGGRGAGPFLTLGIYPRGKEAVWPGLPIRLMALGCWWRR